MKEPHNGIPEGMPSRGIYEASPRGMPDEER
jgi:hypothetical protein